MKKQIGMFIVGYLAGCVVCEYLIERDRRYNPPVQSDVLAFRRRYGALNPLAN